MSTNFTPLTRRRSRRRKGDTAQLAAQLAPLEEHRSKPTGKHHNDGLTDFPSPIAHQEVGAIVVEADSLSLERARRRQHEKFLGLEPVVMVIVGLVLGFIAFIAWQISLMPGE